MQTVPLAVDLVRVGGRVLLAGLKHFAPATLVTDLIVLKALALYGGSGYTPASMARAVEMLEAGEVRSDLVVGEVFDLDGIDEAMALLARTDPTRDAVRVAPGFERDTDRDCPARGSPSDAEAARTVAGRGRASAWRVAAAPNGRDAPGQYASRMSTTKTRVSVPVMPASGLPRRRSRGRAGSRAAPGSRRSGRRGPGPTRR